MVSLSSNPFLFISYLIPKPPSPQIPTDHFSPLEITTNQSALSLSQMARKAVEFEDFLPTMADKLGEEAFMGELCNGFSLLMDKDKGLITLESLKMNSAHLGLQGLREDELLSMLREGDLDGDGCLNQMEFCILMFRLSPDLMEDSKRWLEEALEQELNDFMN